MVRAGARRRTARLLTFAQVEGNLQVDLSERETGRDPIRINHSGCRGKTGQQARETARRLLSKCVYTETHTHVILILHARSFANLSAHCLFIDRFFLRRTSKKKSTTVYSFSRLNC